VGVSPWCGAVTLTTVGYEDIVPNASVGRFRGVAIMFTGIAVLRMLAGSPASLSNVESPSEEEPATAAAPFARWMRAPHPWSRPCYQPGNGRWVNRVLGRWSGVDGRPARAPQASVWSSCAMGGSRRSRCRSQS